MKLLRASIYLLLSNVLHQASTFFVRASTACTFRATALLRVAQEEKRDVSALEGALVDVVQFVSRKVDSTELKELEP